MEEEDKKKVLRQGSIKWGVILGITSTIIFFIIYSEIIGTSWDGWVGLICHIIIIYVGQKEFIENNDNIMSYGQGVKLGTIIGTIGAGISSFFAYFYTKFINIQYLQEEKQNMLQTLLEDESISDSQIDQVMNMGEFFFVSEMIFIVGLILGIFSSFIISLIVSIITKTNKSFF